MKLLRPSIPHVPHFHFTMYSLRAGSRDAMHEHHAWCACMLASTRSSTPAATSSRPRLTLSMHPMHLPRSQKLLEHSEQAWWSLQTRAGAASLRTTPPRLLCSTPPRRGASHLHAPASSLRDGQGASKELQRAPHAEGETRCFAADRIQCLAADLVPWGMYCTGAKV